MHASTAILLGLLVALLPWLPSCPAHISAAALPPPPPRGGNNTGDAQSQDPPANQPSGGANSNSVQGEEKAEARILLPFGDLPVPSTNCTNGNCRDSANTENRNASSFVPAGGPALVGDDVIERPSDGGPEVPLSIRSEGAPDARSEEDDPVPGLNRLEAPRYTEGAVALAKNVLQSQPFPTGWNKTNAAPGAIPSTDSTPSRMLAPSAGRSSAPPPTSTRAAGRSIGGTLNEANHVFSSAPDDSFDSGFSRISAKVAAEAEESSKKGLASVAAKESRARKDQEAEESSSKSKEGDDEGYHGDGDHDDMDGDEDEDSAGVWEHGDGSATTAEDFPVEHTTGVVDDVQFHYKEFTRVEYGDAVEPESTMSFLIVENGSHVDFSSSNVVSEVYDSEAPEEDSSNATPVVSSTIASAETSSNITVAVNHTVAPPDGVEGDLGYEESVESPEDIDLEGLEEILDGESHTTVASNLEKNVGDLEADTGESSPRVTLVQLVENDNSSTIMPSEESAKNKSETVTSPPEPTTVSLNVSSGIDVAPTSGHTNYTNSSYITTSTSTSVSKSESSRVTDPGVQERSSLATTAPSTARTSRRTNLFIISTTESSVKNEVTYNDNVTGPIYDLKANISLTTPMPLGTSSTSTPSTRGRTKWSGLSSSVSPSPTYSPVSVSEDEPTTSTDVESSQLTTLPEEEVTGKGQGNVVEEVTDEGGDGNSTTTSETTSQELTSPAGSDNADYSTTMPPTEVTSPILFKTVEQTSVTDLTIENMSLNLTSEDRVSITEAYNSTSNMYSDGTSEEVTTSATLSYDGVNGTDSTDVMTTIPAFRKSSNNESSATTQEMGTTAATVEVSVPSVTNIDLYPEEMETKVPSVTLIHAADADDSHPKNHQKVTIHPVSTAAESIGSTFPEEFTSSPLVTTFEALGTSPKSTTSPETVQLHGKNEKGKKPVVSDEEGGADDTEVSIRAYPAYVRLWMKISWDEICREQLQNSLKQAVAQLLSTATHRTVPINRVMLLNFAESCPSSMQSDSAKKSLSPVHFCILAVAEKESSERRRPPGQSREEDDKVIVHCDSVLTELFPHLWTQAPQPMVAPLIHVKEVDLVRSTLGSEDGLEYPSNPSDDNTSVLAAIGISCIAAVCLLLIGALLIIMRRRQRRFNYGQRCTPVSLDAYSLDSVSVREGSRRARGHVRNGEAGRGVNGLRKAGDSHNDWRASKRSYGNPAFEDDDGEEILLSKPLNFAALANAAVNEDGALAGEFSLIPKRFHKRTIRRKSRSRYKDPAAAERGEAGISSKDEEEEGLPEGAEEKNRYANVIPLTSTRVRLSPKSSGPLSTYINANYVRGPKNEEQYYIACQAPLSTTIEDFWRMIWEQQSKVILMLTNLVENSVEKCADYLPPSEVLDCHRLFGDYQVTLKKREVREKYIVSSLQLKDMESNLWREVTHLWFLGWPIQGVPDDPSQIIAFLIEARPYIQANTGPTAVHCSPGTGRTGTVIAIDICIRDFEQSRIVDVPRVVQQLRRDRDGAVQTQQQYVFIYQALSLYATKLTGGAMDSF